MQRRDFLKRAGALGLLTLASTLPLSRPARAQPEGERIFAARRNDERLGIVYELSSGTAVEFARLRSQGPGGEWIGGLATSADGRLFALTNAENGSLWDITAGGDFTREQPRARALFAGARPDGNPLSRGLAFDAEGNAYAIVGRDDRGDQPIVKVTPDGTVSQLPVAFYRPRGLVVREGVLYVTQYEKGQVIAVDLATSEAREFASGFAGSPAIAGVYEVSVPDLAVDPRGRLLLLWETVDPGPLGALCCKEPGVFDITDGGDFAGRVGLVRAWRLSGGTGPDGPLAVDGANNVYAASGGDDGWVYVSRFGGEAFAEFEPLARVPGGRATRTTGLAVMRQR